MRKVQSVCLINYLVITTLVTARPGPHPAVITMVPNVGDTPAGLAVTPDSSKVYVANNNNDGLSGGNTVTVIGAARNNILQIVRDSSFNEPYTVTINPAGTKAYVSNSNGSTITILDTVTNGVIGTITGFDGPSGMAISPDGTKGYVNNYGGPILGSGNGFTVNAVDLTTNLIVGSSIIVGLAPAALAMGPDGKHVYVVNYEDGNLGTGTMSIIDTSNNTVSGGAKGFSGPFTIAITPDGQYAYVTNFGSNNFSPVGTTVSVVRLSDNTVIKNIFIGTQPSGLAITPDGRYAYVSVYNTLYLGPSFTNLTPSSPGIVKVIDIATNTLMDKEIHTGLSPASIAISPDNTRAYVSNYSQNSVTVLDISERSWLAS
jgi:YVTN family beta-propeller protein